MVHYKNKMSNKNDISYMSPFYRRLQWISFVVKTDDVMDVLMNISSEPFPHLGCLQIRCIFDLVMVHYIFFFFYTYFCMHISLLYIHIDVHFIWLYCLHLACYWNLIFLVNLKIKIFFFTWGQFWLMGIDVFCSCLSVCVHHSELVHAITHHHFKLGSPN